MPLLRILHNAVVCERILHHLPASVLASFSQCSTETLACVEGFYTHLFRCLLAKYFSKVDSFISILKHIKGCITGSEALRLLMNDAEASWEANDLDISVPAGKASLLCAYLQKYEGYKTPPIHTEAGLPMDEAAAAAARADQRLAYHQVLKRQRLQSVHKLKGKDGRSIDILESSTEDCIAPLCDFHSTAVINALFPDKLTCFFPQYTLRYRSIPNAGFISRRDQKAVAKYAGRADPGLDDGSRGRSTVCKKLEYICAFCKRKHWKIEHGEGCSRRNGQGRMAP